MILLSIQSNFENVVSQGLPIMVAGMMGIFVVIGIIILAVALLGKVNSDGLLAKGIRALFTKTK